MRPIDYRMSSKRDRKRWLEDTFRITTGLGYFGGKQFIGKYLMNRLLNMAVRMMEDGKRAGIFIDAFTGGGKIGLSVPEGWFEKTVINDMDYGVASYFKYCKENPEALIKKIEELGKYMDGHLFLFFACNRCNSSPDAIKKLKGAYAVKEGAEWVANLVSGETVSPLLAAAMTYWVVHSEYFGCTAPERVSYALDIEDRKEGDKEGDKKKRTHEMERIRNNI